MKDLLEKIKRDGETESKKIVEEARKKAKEIADNAKKEGELIKKRYLERAKKEAEGIKKREIAKANLEARKLELKFKDDAIKRVIEESINEISNIRKSKRYEQALFNLAKEALDVIGVKEVKFLLNSEDLEVFENKILPKLVKEYGLKNVEVEKTSIIGGVNAVSKDGRFCVENSIDARLERYKDSLRKEIASVLFEK